MPNSTRALSPLLARCLVLAAAVALSAPACASRPVVENHTFYEPDANLKPGSGIEIPYPPLDLAARTGGGAYTGVTVLGGFVRFSRPTGWQIRRASTAKGRQFVEYVSPRAYLFAVYERDDDLGASWSDVMKEYESDAKRSGLEWTGKAVPIAGYDVQGEEYFVRRKVKGQRAPYENTSREIIFQGKHATALVEIVHQGLSDASIEGELLRTVETLTVL